MFDATLTPAHPMGEGEPLKRRSKIAPTPHLGAIGGPQGAKLKAEVVANIKERKDVSISAGQTIV